MFSELLTCYSAIAVLAGLLFGWGWFSLCSIAFGGRLLTLGLPVEAAEKVADVVADETTPAGARYM